MELLELLMALRSSVEISSPHGSSSSIKVWIPFSFKKPFKWLVKSMRVSSPLKLKNTSYMYWWVIEEEEAHLFVRKAIVKWYVWEDLKGTWERKLDEIRQRRARFWNLNRIVWSDRENREPLIITVLLCSRIGLCPKSREPFELRFNHTVLRIVIRPLLTVPFESEPLKNIKKNKKKIKKIKRRKRNTACLYVSSSSLFRAHHAAPSLQKLFSWAKQVLNSSFVLRR